MPRLHRVALSVLLTLAPTVAAAQAWRTLDISRPLDDGGALRANVAFGAGTLNIRPDRASHLYDLSLRYDADRASPVYAFDAAERTLRVGVRYAEDGSSRWRSDRGSELRLALPTTLDLDLSIEAGAAESDIDLSGLRLSALSLAVGAADTKLRIDQPNARRMPLLRLDAGAANLEALRLAHARADRIVVNVGVGRVLLDLTGSWEGDTDVEVSAALGKVELVVPQGVGIRIEVSSLLQSVELPGLTKVGSAWVSPDFDTAPHKLRLTASGALGRIELRRTTR
jgi:hypothetical protein